MYNATITATLGAVRRRFYRSRQRGVLPAIAVLMAVALAISALAVVVSASSFLLLAGAILALAISGLVILAFVAVITIAYLLSKTRGRFRSSKNGLAWHSDAN